MALEPKEESLEPVRGFEPLTCGLRNRCSATELHRLGRNSRHESKPSADLRAPLVDPFVNLCPSQHQTFRSASLSPFLAGLARHGSISLPLCGCQHVPVVPRRLEMRLLSQQQTGVGVPQLVEPDTLRVQLWPSACRSAWWPHPGATGFHRGGKSCGGSPAQCTVLDINPDEQCSQTVVIVLSGVYCRNTTMEIP